MDLIQERVNQLLDLFNNRAPIAKTFGMILSYKNVDTENNLEARIDLPYNPSLDHALGGIHGGIYSTMIDNAAWFVSAAISPLSTWVATSDLSIRLLEPVSESHMYSIGNVIKTGKRIIVAKADLFEESGKLVGTGTGSFVVLGTNSKI